MTGKRLYRIILCAALAAYSAIAQAEDGGSFSGFTPYSMYGLGNLSNGGSAYNNTMGGVGIASRNNRFINSLNPAAVTARDTLSFMSDVSLSQMNTVFRHGSMTSAANVFNMNDFILSTPIAGKLALMAGVKPFSSTGYSYGYYDYSAELGSIANSYSGQGSVYQLFVAAGYPVFKGMSLGLEYIHYFGNINRNYTQTIEDKASLGISKTEDMYLTANTAKAGLQYEFKASDKMKVCLGATYKMGAKLSGYLTTTSGVGEASQTSVVDPLALRANPLSIASEMGFGVSINYLNRFRAEIDYTRSDWTGTGYDNEIFVGGVTESVRAGLEIIPNPNEIRYYHKLIAYRAGVYVTRENYVVNGSPVISRGITLGATLPVYRWYNGITLGVELGQRGTLRNDLIRETYVGFNLGVNLFDIWFQKYRYE